MNEIMNNENPSKYKPLKGLTVGLDVDGVLAAYITSFHQWLNQHQIAHNYHETKMPEQWFSSKEEWAEHHKNAIDDDLLIKLDPMPHVHEGLQTLRDAGAHLVVVTARGVSDYDLTPSEKDTEKWLKLNNIDVEDIRHADPKPQEDVDIHIDDTPRHIHEVHNAGKVGVLMHHPWNTLEHVPAHYQPIPGPRLHSWKHVGALIDNYLAYYNPQHLKTQKRLEAD